jgi:hypothetical protein
MTSRNRYSFEGQVRAFIEDPNKPDSFVPIQEASDDALAEEIAALRTEAVELSAKADAIETYLLQRKRQR